MTGISLIWKYAVIGIKGMIASLVCGVIIGAVLVILLSGYPGAMTGLTILLTLPVWGWFVNHFFKWK
jgi:hypothetical protein